MASPLVTVKTGASVDSLRRSTRTLSLTQRNCPTLQCSSYWRRIHEKQQIARENKGGLPGMDSNHNKTSGSSLGKNRGERCAKDILSHLGATLSLRRF